jgi:hypothetical protein
MKTIRTLTLFPKAGPQSEAGLFRVGLVCTIGVVAWSAIFAALL